MFSWGITLFWAYVALEANLFLIYRRCIKKCRKRLESADGVSPKVKENILKQLKAMPRIRTFYRDLFGASDHSEIKYKNLENLFVHTIGEKSPECIRDMISQAEEKINYTFEEGYNACLQHTYCKEDLVVRSRYVPALLTSPILLLKFVFDQYVNRFFKRINSRHAVYWVHDKGNGKDSNRVLQFMCGIGIGPITYLKLVQQFLDDYDIIIMVELKWISFHISTDPVPDRLLIDDVASFVVGYLQEAHLGCFCALTTQFCEHCDNHHENNKTFCGLDLMMHSGGALYFRRIIEKIAFDNKVLIEPACFLSGSSTATRQLYTYDTYHPLFQYPLVKNLPKLLDIAECVLQTDTPMNNSLLILSRNDTLFNPGPCFDFMKEFHPSVPVYFIERSGHGDAVAKHCEETAKVIRRECFS